MSRRNDIAEYIKTRISSIVTTDIVDVYTQSYREVTRDPIDLAICNRLAAGEACVGVYDVAEEKTRTFNATQCTLTVILEFYYRPKVGQVKSAELNRLLSELTKRVMVDYQQGGLALNTQEVTNQLDIDGVYDKIINGSITFEVTYRHGFFDPTKDLC